MIERWYRLAQPGERLSQGDLIFRCPILAWKSIPVEMESNFGAGALSQMIDPFEDDVVISTAWSSRCRIARLGSASAVREKPDSQCRSRFASTSSLGGGDGPRSTRRTRRKMRAER